MSKFITSKLSSMITSKQFAQSSSKGNSNTSNNTAVTQQPQRPFNKVVSWVKAHPVSEDKVMNAADKLAVFIRRMALIGLIMKVIAGSIYPELPEVCPVLYTWCTFWIDVIEWIFRFALGGTYALFTGKFLEFVPARLADGWALVQKLLEWLATIV